MGKKLVVSTLCTTMLLLAMLAASGETAKAQGEKSTANVNSIVDGCTHFTKIDDATRNIQQPGFQNDKCEKEMTKEGAWYRFTHQGNTMIPTDAPKGDKHCGSHAAGYQTYPNPEKVGQVTTGNMAFLYMQHQRYFQVAAKTKLCKDQYGKFYAYFLRKPPVKPPVNCQIRYCTTKDAFVKDRFTVFLGSWKGLPMRQLEFAFPQVQADTMLAVSPLVAAGTARLSTNAGVPKTNSADGILQMHVGGAWKFVCDDSFDEKDGKVACRDMGFEGFVKYYHGQTVTAKNFYDDLACTGNEQKLNACPRAKTPNCSVTEGVRLVCKGRNTVIENYCNRLNMKPVCDNAPYCPQGATVKLTTTTAVHMSNPAHWLPKHFPQGGALLIEKLKQLKAGTDKDHPQIAWWRPKNAGIGGLVRYSKPDERLACARILPCKSVKIVNLKTSLKKKIQLAKVIKETKTIDRCNSDEGGQEKITFGDNTKKTKLTSSLTLPALKQLFSEFDILPKIPLRFESGGSYTLKDILESDTISTETKRHKTTKRVPVWTNWTDKVRTLKARRLYKFQVRRHKIREIERLTASAQCIGEDGQVLSEKPIKGRFVKTYLGQLEYKESNSRRACAPSPAPSPVDEE